MKSKFISNPVKKVLLLPLALAVAACGGDWSEYEADLKSLPDNTVQSATYPTGPFGTKVGEKIDNLIYSEAFFDPYTMCKSSTDLDISLTRGTQKLSFLDLYKGNPLCPKKKKQFVWLIASAEW